MYRAVVSLRRRGKRGKAWRSMIPVLWCARSQAAWPAPAKGCEVRGEKSGQPAHGRRASAAWQSRSSAMTEVTRAATWRCPPRRLRTAGCVHSLETHGRTEASLLKSCGSFAHPAGGAGALTGSAVERLAAGGRAYACVSSVCVFEHQTHALYAVSI